MTPQAQRAAVNDPSVWARLTDHQRRLVQLCTLPTSSGERRSVAGLAKGLGIDESSLRETLRLANAKFA